MYQLSQIVNYLEENSCVEVEDYPYLEDGTGKLYRNVLSGRKTLLTDELDISPLTFVHNCYCLGILPPPELEDLYDMHSGRINALREKFQSSTVSKP